MMFVFEAEDVVYSYAVYMRTRSSTAVVPNVVTDSTRKKRSKSGPPPPKCSHYFGPDVNA